MTSTVKPGLDNARAKIEGLVREASDSAAGDWHQDLQLFEEVFKTWAFNSINGLNLQGRKLFFDSHFKGLNGWKLVDDGRLTEWSPTGTIMEEITASWDKELSAQALWFISKRSEKLGLSLEAVKFLEKASWVEGWKVCKELVAFSSKKKDEKFAPEWNAELLKKVKRLFVSWIQKTCGASEAFSMGKDLFQFSDVKEVSEYLEDIEETWGPRAEKARAHTTVLASVNATQESSIAMASVRMKRFCFDCGAEWRPGGGHVHEKFCGACGTRLKAGVIHNCGSAQSFGKAPSK